MDSASVGEVSFLAGVASDSGALHGRPAGLQPGDRHSEWGARDVIQTHFIEEVNRIRIPAMFTTDSAMQIWPSTTAAFDSNADKFAHSLAID